MRFFPVLIFSVFFICCTDKYHKYQNVPDYITKASGLEKAYFEAYDEALKLWNVSLEELYIPTTKGIAHVIVSGPKNTEPIVLLHGMNASSTMWYPNIEALSKSYRVFAIDLILEPGKSHLQNDIESIGRVADWYQEVLSILELDSFHLIGASRGGWFAVDLALKNREKIKSLILLSPAQTFTWIRPSTELLKNAVTLLFSKEKQIEQSLESLSIDVANIDEVYLRQYKIGMKKHSGNKFMIDMRPFSYPELNSLQMPVLTLIGDDDMINGKGTVEIANRLPKGQGEVVRNAGHFLSIDQAGKVNRRMLDFLKLP